MVVALATVQSMFPLLILGVVVVVIPFLVAAVGVLRGTAGTRNYLFAGSVSVLLSLVAMKAFFTLAPLGAIFLSLVVLAVPVLHISGLQGTSRRERTLFGAVYLTPVFLELLILVIEFRAVASL